MRSLIRSVAAVVAVLTALTTLTIVTSASAETKTYQLKSPYVRSIGFANNTGAVVVKLRAKKVPRSVRIQGWGAGLDTVADHKVYGQPGEFFVNGSWKRPQRVRLYVNVEDAETDGRVRCPGLKVKVTHARKGRKVVIPRTCLFYAPTETEAAAVRLQAGVYGDRRTKSGFTCRGAGAPKKGWTPWLAVGDGATRAAPAAGTPGPVRRGC